MKVGAESSSLGSTNFFGQNFKQEDWLMKNPIMVGLDLHTETMTLCVATRAGRRWNGVYPADRAGRKKMFQELEKKGLGEEIHLAYEASGLGFKLYDEAVERGIHCYVLAPTKIEKSVSDLKTKTDLRDAEKLLEIVRGHVLAGNKMPSIWVPGHETRDDRELLRARVDLSDETVRAKVKIRSLLKRHDIRPPKSAGSGWTQDLRMFLEKQTEGRRRLGSGGQEALEVLLERLKELEKEKTRLDKAIQKLSKVKRLQGPLKEMMKIKGVGLLTAMVVLTELGNFSRFSNRRQIGRYIGLVPKTNETGEANDRKGHITHQGSSRVRKLLCQAVWTQVRFPGAERDAYERIGGRNPRHKKVAVVALMRRLAIRLWHVGLDAQMKEKMKFQAA